MCLHAAVVWNTSVTDTDFILGTCVVKPDDCTANDGLGISHSVTHRRSSQKAHVHGTRTERRGKKNEKRRRKTGRTKEEGDGKRNRKCRSYVDKNRMIVITQKEFVKRNEGNRRSKIENLTNKQTRVVVAQAPPGVYNTSAEPWALASHNLNVCSWLNSAVAPYSPDSSSHTGISSLVLRIRLSSSNTHTLVMLST